LDFQTVAHHSTPRLFEELLRAVKPSSHTGPDHLRGEAAIHIWRKYRPDVMLVHFVGYDQQAHRYGPRAREALAALELADHEIGRLRATVSHDDRVAVVVLSDHGFLPVEKEAAPLAILVQEGLFDMKGKKHPELKRLGAVHAGGSFAVFWLEEPSSPEQQALERALKQLKETGAVAEVVGRDKLERLGSDPDAEWILDAAPGYFFSDRFSGPMIRKADKDRGTHGQLPGRAGMEAAFIAAGPGIAPGKDLGRIKLTDVAPTLANLLGVAIDELATDAEPLSLA
jgi:predicted AlkP superfamily pyrophosphatase or phosphodiesterase